MNGSPIRVLIVDDEPAMRRGLVLALSSTGYAIDEARNGEEAVRTVRERSADLVLLDINMPGIDGIEACRRIRSLAPNAGILMITVRDAEEDTVRALSAGADDYIIKPFRVRDLIARLRAVLRRSHAESAPEVPVLRAGKLELDRRRRAVRKSGEEIHLSPTEFDLLFYLMQHKEIPLEHSELLRTIWGPEYGHELEYLRVYIRLIRKKIEDDPTQPEYIVTEPWVGYRFRDPLAPPMKPWSEERAEP